ncbi:hypothetical protein Peur_022138 [Populus x canadensis]
MVFLAALDFWILVALRWWNEQGESVSQSLARLNKKDSWLYWWTLFLNVHAAAWVILGIFSVKRFEADYVLVVAVCASLGIANIVAFTKCRKGCQEANSRICIPGSCVSFHIFHTVCTLCIVSCLNRNYPDISHLSVSVMANCG